MNVKQKYDLWLNKVTDSELKQELKRNGIPVRI